MTLTEAQREEIDLEMSDDYEDQISLHVLQECENFGNDIPSVVIHFMLMSLFAKKADDRKYYADCMQYAKSL